MPTCPNACGWVRSGDDWTECKDCHGSGETGVRAPDEILLSNGRISRGEHYMYGPAKPKPAVRVVRDGD